ncbi:TPA: GntP family permease, partial [Raoultella planticola]|nr:GntP family permease [Raoultella planticola]
MSDKPVEAAAAGMSPALKGALVLGIGLIIFNPGSTSGEELDSFRVIGGLLVAIAALLFMILKTRIPAFPALIIAAVITGSLGGMKSEMMIASVTRGFGGTLGNIGIVIGFGVMMGSLLQMSGASKRMAISFINLLGKGREELALVMIGLIVSMAVFCDSAFIVLVPLVKAISRSTGKSVVGLGATLAAGLVISHSMIPPAVGPFGVVSQFNMPIGRFMLWSMVVAVPVAIAGFLYTRRLGNAIFLIPTEDGSGFTRERPVSAKESVQQEESLPGKVISFAPLMVPIVLILLATFFKEFGYIEPDSHAWQQSLVQMVIAIGHPVTAVGTGLLIAIIGLGSRYERKEVTQNMENAIRSAGI